MTVPRRAAAALRRAPHPFWRFSLRAYRRPGAEAAFLELQDEAGTDTNILLWCCWQASTGRALDRRTLRRAMKAVAGWQADVILPLRHARRALKQTAAAPPSLPPGWADDLRRRIGAAELDMEYAEQCLLYELAQTLPAPARRHEPRAAAQSAIARYLGLLGAVVTPAIERHVAVLIAACLPETKR